MSGTTSEGGSSRILWVWKFHEFGLPRYMRVYPMLEVGFAKQHKTLVDLLEEPLIFGMNESGWVAHPARFQSDPE